MFIRQSAYPTVFTRGDHRDLPLARLVDYHACLRSMLCFGLPRCNIARRSVEFFVFHLSCIISHLFSEPQPLCLFPEILPSPL
jgi:hypothetical protein